MTFSKLPDFNISLFHELTESDLIYSKTWRRWAGRSTSRSQRGEIPTYDRLVKASSRLPSSSRWLFPLMLKSTARCFHLKKIFIEYRNAQRKRSLSAHFIQDRDWRLALAFVHNNNMCKHPQTTEVISLCYHREADVQLIKKIKGCSLFLWEAENLKVVILLQQRFSKWSHKKTERPFLQITTDARLALYN